ncbi:hypothetical protein CTAM01_02893 [Colletotrichum tamarilloi]|uniref:Secreted protein n=1 Tax=Colletotrichum tamarilloi TaxID=1209934 RepID=A0ABQ9RNI8_9PEZI|nr:uncharacterized protein CTAM01_02893 [Colletotrichum tamarilloi]KAK1507781.1 hypothetical protein CTAM01_02893 [Colletotrichum tamarilloi]
MKIAFHLLFPSVSITNVATHTPVTTHTNQPGNGSAHALKKRELLSKRADEAAQRSSPGENRDGGAACGVPPFHPREGLAASALLLKTIPGAIRRRNGAVDYVC